jgi:hypothetical protein
MAIHKNFGKGKGLTTELKPNDKIFTPLNIAKEIIAMFDLQGTVLDAFMGNGAFYNQYPNNVKKDWCEIDKGKDFFKYTEKVDWIITNPPYSILENVLYHSFKIADNIVYLVPLSKIVSSIGRIRKISKFGGVPLVYILSASKCGFPFGFPCCAIHIKKDYSGKTQIKIDGANK